MLKRRSLVLVIVFVCLLFRYASAEDLLLRDDWFVLEQAGIPNGFGNEQFFKTSEGYQYRGFFQIQMDFLGTPFVYLEHIDASVDHEFRLTKILRVTDFDGAQTRHDVVISYSEELTELWAVELDATGRPYESYFNWVGPYPIYTTTSLVDKVIRDEGLVVGSEYTFNTWTVSGVAPTVFKIEEVASIDYNGQEILGFIASQVTGEMTLRALLDEAGVTYVTETVGLDTSIKKVEEHGIPELQSMAADVLMVPANLIVDHPYRSTSSLITVDWLDVPIEEFHWGDNRQQIANVLSENSVQLAIHQDPRDFTGRIQLPVVGEEFLPYLADTDYIKPSLPLVQSLVQEILAGETDAWRGTELILNWVFQNITGKMVARTLTTKEILEMRAGKCSEYATLFAALARAAGLPTKIALGERYQGNFWVGHLWNEVWLGEWVAVDPSHNQIAPDATLVKFIDSDTIMGTQGIRLALVNKLNITIDEITMAERTSDLDLVTGLVGQQYTNAQYSCSITLPGGFEGLETEDQGFPVLVMYDPAQPSFSALLVMMSVPPGSKAEQLMASRLMILPTVLPDFELLTETTGSIAGEPGSIASFKFADAVMLVQENRIIAKEDVAYLFVFTSTEAEWPLQQDLIDQMLASFVIHQ